MTNTDTIELALRMLRKHDDLANCMAVQCGCAALDLPELIENLKDDHTKAVGELRRLKLDLAAARTAYGLLKDAVDRAGYDIATWPNFTMSLEKKGTVVT